MSFRDGFEDDEEERAKGVKTQLGLRVVTNSLEAGLTLTPTAIAIAIAIAIVSSLVRTCQ